ncbi:MAG TPA: DUF3455 domain-containing protein [Pyrinomonadaceae bacterium]|nr:DUF3455 domain-containing protein [Pyrinomonadaceae bacterium]
MPYIELKKIIGLAALFSVAALVLATATTAFADEIAPPTLPTGCERIQVEAGNEVAFRTYAIGVQIWKWNGTSWGFVAPEASLFADAGFHGKVGTHYAGPTWESNSGSKVVGARVDGCTPDASDIPWLLLRKVTTDGAGIFSDVTFIQRVNTNGGIAPTTPGTTIDQIERVPYTTEYYFYKASTN